MAIDRLRKLLLCLLVVAMTAWAALVVQVASARAEGLPYIGAPAAAKIANRELENILNLSKRDGGSPQQPLNKMLEAAKINPNATVDRYSNPDNQCSYWHLIFETKLMPAASYAGSYKSYDDAMHKKLAHKVYYLVIYRDLADNQPQFCLGVDAKSGAFLYYGRR